MEALYDVILRNLEFRELRVQENKPRNSVQDMCRGHIILRFVQRPVCGVRSRVHVHPRCKDGVHPNGRHRMPCKHRVYGKHVLQCGDPEVGPVNDDED